MVGWKYGENGLIEKKHMFLFFWGGHVFNSLHKRGNILMNETIWVFPKIGVMFYPKMGW